MREKQQDRQGLTDLIDAVGSENVITVEIGSYAGESAEIFINTGKVAKIICIDPWSVENHGDGNTYLDIKSAELKFDEVASRHPDKIVKFTGTSDTFLLSDAFKEYSGRIDLVYIDGLHTYDGCRNDIVNALTRIKPRIAVAGHDYADRPDYIRGVKKAVNEAFGDPDRTFCDTSWIKYINKI